MKHPCLPSADTSKPKDSVDYLLDSGIMVILVFFQLSGYRNFKIFYSPFLLIYFHHTFPQLYAFYSNHEIEYDQCILVQMLKGGVDE